MCGARQSYASSWMDSTSLSVYLAGVLHTISQVAEISALKKTFGPCALVSRNRKSGVRGRQASPPIRRSREDGVIGVDKMPKWCYPDEGFSSLFGTRGEQWISRDVQRSKFAHAGSAKAARTLLIQRERLTLQHAAVGSYIGLWGSYILSFIGRRLRKFTGCGRRPGSCWPLSRLYNYNCECQLPSLSKTFATCCATARRCTSLHLDVSKERPIGMDRGPPKPGRLMIGTPRVCESRSESGRVRD